MEMIFVKRESLQGLRRSRLLLLVLATAVVLGYLAFTAGCTTSQTTTSAGGDASIASNATGHDGPQNGFRPNGTPPDGASPDRWFPNGTPPAGRLPGGAFNGTPPEGGPPGQMGLPSSGTPPPEAGAPAP